MAAPPSPRAGDDEHRRQAGEVGEERRGQRVPRVRALQVLPRGPVEVALRDVLALAVVGVEGRAGLREVDLGRERGGSGRHLPDGLFDLQPCSTIEQPLACRPRSSPSRRPPSEGRRRRRPGRARPARALSTGLVPREGREQGRIDVVHEYIHAADRSPKFSRGWGGALRNPDSKPVIETTGIFY